MEEEEEEGDSGDFHINATLSSLKEAVKNGLLDDAFSEEDENTDSAKIETNKVDEALATENKASDVFEAKNILRKNLLATSTSIMYRKLVKNSTV